LSFPKSRLPFGVGPVISMELETFRVPFGPILVKGS